MSLLEELFLKHVTKSLPSPDREYRFCERKWPFDFSWPEIKLAVEIEGGTRKRGRHNRHEGFSGDCEKYNRAAADGWCLLRFTGEMVTKGYAAAATIAVFDGKPIPRWSTWSPVDMQAYSRKTGKGPACDADEARP